MYKIFFGIGHFLEATFAFIVALEWLPVIVISLLLTFGFFYWLYLQKRYSDDARRRGTMI